MSDQSRRKLLKSIAAGSGVIVAGKSLPETWTRPVVDSVLLPAHAQTSGITLTSTGVIAGLGMNTDSNSMMASQDGLLDSLISSAHAGAQVEACPMEGKCVTVLLPGGDSVTVTISSIGHDSITLSPSNTAYGEVAGIPFTLQLNGNRTAGTISFQDSCGGYGVQVEIDGSCSQIPAPAACVGQSETINSNSGGIDIVFDGVNPATLHLRPSIGYRDVDTMVLVTVNSNMSIGRGFNWSPNPATVELGIPDGTYTRTSTRMIAGQPIGDTFEVTFCVTTSDSGSSKTLTVVLVSMVKI